MKAFDPSLASPFRIEWLTPLDAVTQDDYSRAIAEKAEPILRAARFIHAHQGKERTDMEIRVWVEAAVGSACVSVTWEPGPQRYGFHLLDETLRDRLACIVFHALPCVDAEESLQQADRVLDAALFAMTDARGADLEAIADAIRNAKHDLGTDYVRVPVKEVETTKDE